jgi:hypothetical protein
MTLETKGGTNGDGTGVPVKKKAKGKKDRTSAEEVIIPSKGSRSRPRKEDSP